MSLGPLLVEILSKESLIFRFLGLNFSLAAMQPIKETRLLSPSEMQAQALSQSLISIISRYGPLVQHSKGLVKDSITVY